jgi:hypothetical protein
VAASSEHDNERSLRRESLTTVSFAVIRILLHGVRHKQSHGVRAKCGTGFR